MESPFAVLPRLLPAERQLSGGLRTHVQVDLQQRCRMVGWSAHLIRFDSSKATELILALVTSSNDENVKINARGVSTWTIVGFILLVNIFSMIVSVGATNLRHEQKLDPILKSQGQDLIQIN